MAPTDEPGSRVDYTVDRRVFFWRHARRRMSDPTREVSEQEVLAVLRGHNVDVQSDVDPAARILIGTVGERRIRVVIKPHHRSVEVITAMPVRSGRGESMNSE